MKKGITPIIAVIILLLITVALAGMAWVFMSGYFTTYTSKNVVALTQYCTGTTSHVVLRNTGTATISLGTCDTANSINGGTTQTCGDVTIVKTAGGNLNNGEVSAATVASQSTVEFTEECGTANICTYMFVTQAGVGPSASATVNC